MSSGTFHFLGRSSAFGNHGNTAAYYIEERRGFTYFNLIDCGYDVFDKLKKKFDFNEFDFINVYITHLHPDHAGSLGQFIFYLYYFYHKKVNVCCNCTGINEYLKLCGVEVEKHCRVWYVPSAIRTSHVPEIDSYGFVNDTVEGKRIVYTGDTNSLDSFDKRVQKEGGWAKVDELYVEASIYGGVHLNIAENLDRLLKIQEGGTKVYLMHLDDEVAISKITGGRLEFVTVEH